MSEQLPPLPEVRFVTYTESENPPQCKIRGRFQFHAGDARIAQAIAVAQRAGLLIGWQKRGISGPKERKALFRYQKALDLRQYYRSLLYEGE